MKDIDKARFNVSYTAARALGEGGTWWNHYREAVAELKALEAQHDNPTP